MKPLIEVLVSAPSKISDSISDRSRRRWSLVAQERNLNSPCCPARREAEWKAYGGEAAGLLPLNVTWFNRL